MMMRASILLFASAMFALSACQTTGTGQVQTNSPVSGQSGNALPGNAGEIIFSEPVSGVATNELMNVGAAALGVLVPGPWGGVAQQTARSAGTLAQSSTQGAMRYHIRFPNGETRVIMQRAAPALPAGTPVNIITLADGSIRVVPG